MKNNVKRSMLFVLLFVLAAALRVTAFAGSSFSLNPEHVSIRIGQSMKPAVSGSAAVVKWESDDPEIVSVVNGVVTGRKAGRATITATAKNGETAEFSVLVVYEQRGSLSQFVKDVAKGLTENRGTVTSIASAENGQKLNTLIVKSKGPALDFSGTGAIAVYHGFENVYFVQYANSRDTAFALKEIEAWDNIVYVTQDRAWVAVPELTGTASNSVSIQSDEFNSWGVEAIGADKFAAALSEQTSAPLTVAVVDTGVYLHKDFGSRIRSDGWNLVAGNNDSNDNHGHGTHVSGTILECTKGLNVSILPVKVLGADGTTSTTAMCLGILYAVDRGAKVINLSLSGDHEPLTEECLQFALDMRVTVVAAAGNEGSDIDHVLSQFTGQYGPACPAHVTQVITVGAVDPEGKRWSRSNYGKSLDLVAPGVGVRSQLPNDNYVTADGTSMATPHVSALAAMMKLAHPEYSPSKIQSVMKKYCSGHGERLNNEYGYGFPDFSNYFEAGTVISHTHELCKTIKAAESTCVKAGNIEFYECSCGDFFKDKECTEPIEGSLDAYSQIPATGHKWDGGKVSQEPTPSKYGFTVYTCTVCGVQEEKTTDKLGAWPGLEKGKTINTTSASYKVVSYSGDTPVLQYVKPRTLSSSSVVIKGTVTLKGHECKVTSIADDAFRANTQITELRINTGVQTIGARAFYKCTNLKSVIFGKDVKTIGYCAFYKCTKLAKYYVNTLKLAASSVAEKVFYGCYASPMISVPSSKVSAYKSIFYNRNMPRTARWTAIK